MDTGGGQYAWPTTSSYCYCREDVCGCWTTQMWPTDVVMPPGLSVLSSYGTIGRMSIDPSESCPPGTTRRDQDGFSECAYKPGAYVYRAKNNNPTVNLAQRPGALSP